MLFQSTRSNAPLVSASRAVLDGLAPDGGLYVPQGGVLPRIDPESLLGLDDFELSAVLMQRLLSDYTPEEMRSMTENAYRGRFETEDLTPLVRVGDNYVLELFRGPTSAFKDVALCMLPRLMTKAREKQQVNDEILILTATSGDTGKAALEGFHDVPGTSIAVFYPDEGVSRVQKAQMATQEGANVHVCAVRGNFDDAQTGVKQTFAACAAGALPAAGGVRLSSANSINIGRLVPQVVYYFRAYCKLRRSGVLQSGASVDFVVPTGNFGDILAGWFAKEMGLPVGKLVCASNCNDVLTEFLNTGRYDRNRPFYKTVSPSMDILISSNLERLLYLLTKDPEAVSGWMSFLSKEGRYEIPGDLLLRLKEDFSCSSCGEEETKEQISAVWSQFRYLMDTHTAVAWKAAQEYRNASMTENPVVVLSTASAYKFPAAVLSALGENPSGDEFEDIVRLERLTGVPAPRQLRTLFEKPVLHREVIGKQDILNYVLGCTKK